jgi:hypothetical protein
MNRSGAPLTPSLPMNPPVARCPLTLPSPPVGERFHRKEISRFEPLNRTLKDRRMKRGAKVARTLPQCGTDASSWRSSAARSVWSACVFSAALGGRFMGRVADMSRRNQMEAEDLVRGWFRGPKRKTVVRGILSPSDGARVASSQEGGISRTRRIRFHDGIESGLPCASPAVLVRAAANGCLVTNSSKARTSGMTPLQLQLSIPPCENRL